MRNEGHNDWQINLDEKIQQTNDCYEVNHKNTSNILPS